MLGQHLPKKHCLPAITGLPLTAPQRVESAARTLPGPQFSRSPDASVSPGRLEFGLYQNVCLTLKRSGEKSTPGRDWRSGHPRILECLVGKAGAGGAQKGRDADGVERKLWLKLKVGAWRSLETSSSGIPGEDGGRGYRSK